MKPTHQFLFVLCAGIFLLFSTSCSTVSYYSQSANGHFALMAAREPINTLLADDLLDPELRRQLELSVDLRQYAVTDIALPDNKSYTTYVKLDDKYPVWSVVAAEPFSLQPKQWCYPVIGCASYRGYFEQKAAQQYADTLQSEGLETHIGGVTAYSTLGWFADPLVSSMHANGDLLFAEVLFHELAHQQLYVKNDSAFNEAFASMVGEQATLRWLHQERPDKVIAYKQFLQARNQFLELLNEYRTRLEEIYTSEFDIDMKRTMKQAEFDNLFADYELLRDREWQGKQWFDRWFDTPVNNARIALISTYRGLITEFERWFWSCHEDFGQFYQRMQTLVDDNPTQAPSELILKTANCEA